MTSDPGPTDDPAPDPIALDRYTDDGNPNLPPDQSNALVTDHNPVSPDTTPHHSEVLP